MSDYCHITIETRGPKGEWSQYSPLDHAGDMPGIGLNPDVNLLTDEVMLQDILPQDNIIGFDNGALVQATLQGSETVGAFPDPMVDSWFSTRGTPLDNIIGPQFNDNHTMTPHSNNYQMSCILWEPPPFLQLLLKVPMMTLNENSTRTGASPVQQIARTFSARLLGYSAAVLRRNETPARMDMILRPPTIESVSQRLVELVQEIESQSDLFGITFGANSLPCAILYSIANGFTGLSEIPASSVVKLLKNEPHVYATLHKLLLDAPALFAKPFAENLLKASVEAADAEAVRVIAGTMMQRGIQINPNELMCECDGMFVTPAELAGKLRRVDLLQVLLKLGADPNKTFESDPDDIHGALEWALDVQHVNGIILEGEIEPSLALVQMLIDAGAKVKAEYLLRSAKWCCDSRILASILGNIGDGQHASLSLSLPELIGKFDDDLGIQATQKLLQAWEGPVCQCRTKTCQDPRDLKHCLQQSLDKAVVRKNLGLCQLILSRTVPGRGALTRAIRKANHRYASLLIQHGACVSECYRKGGRPIRSGGFYAPGEFLTPLGEAIRLQDPSMLQLVEEQGAWSFVSDRGYLDSVAEAAADVGDMAVLERLFAMDIVRDLDPTPGFENALEAATRKEHILIVKLLLDNGARPHATILELALKAKNGELVRMILDSGIIFPSDGTGDYGLEVYSEVYRCALELAIEWGDMEIVEELIHAKAHYSLPQQGSRGLCAAIRSGNAVLVDLLLSAGVNPDATYKYYKGSKRNVIYWTSPLSTAVKSGNEEMAHHLLQKGADPANAQALSLAIELDKTSLFGTLLTAFRQSYPVGRSDFGAVPLIRAIEKEGCPYFEELLEAKMNVNHLSQRHGRTPLGSAVERHGTTYLEIAARLLESGADPNAIARVDAVEHTRHHPDALEPPKTALLIAIEAGNEEMVELLLKSRAGVNKEARRGITRTPLQSACQRRSLPIVQLLLRWGADVNAPPSIRNGGTALQLACLSGSIRIVRHLLSVGANIFGPTSNANGRSALENAAENGRLDVIKVLWDATGGCGFPATEIARAQRFARARGLPGCAEYVAKLAEASLLDFSMTIRP